MSLQCFQQILSVRSCDITPLSHLLLSDDAEQLMQQLEQLKAAIEGSTRVIAAFILVRKNADLIVEKADSIIFSMYHQLIAALKEKATMQLYLKRTIKQHPYGPYADLFRAPDSPHDDFGRIFSPREIERLPMVPLSFFDKSFRYRKTNQMYFGLYNDETHLLEFDWNRFRI